MENKTSINASRGNRKQVSLVIFMGEEQAVIHPRYLHASEGQIRGIYIDQQRYAQCFSVSPEKFRKTKMLVVEDFS